MLSHLLEKTDLNFSLSLWMPRSSLLPSSFSPSLQSLLPFIPNERGRLLLLPLSRNLASSTTLRRTFLLLLVRIRIPSKSHSQAWRPSFHRVRPQQPSSSPSAPIPPLCSILLCQAETLLISVLLLTSHSPPSPFLVTFQRSPTPYPVGSPNAFATSSSPSRTGPSSTPTRTPSRRLNNLLPPPPLQPDTPSTSTGPGTAGCGFDIYHDGASPINGASSSSSLLFENDLTVAASPAPSESSIFEDYQPDKENKATISIPSIPLYPSPLKRRRDLELEQQEEEEEEENDDEDEQPLASTSSLTGSPVKGWKGKGRELSFVPEVEEEAEEEFVSVVMSVSKGKGKSRATSTRNEGKGKGRAILEFEADEGDLVADEGLELTPGRRILAVAVEKKRVAPRSPEKKRRGQ